MDFHPLKRQDKSGDPLHIIAEPVKPSSMIRNACCFLLFLTAAITGRAQQPFEGRIDYLLTSRDSGVRVLVTTFYGYNKIYFETSVIKAPAALNAKNEKILLDFDSSYIDRYHDDEKKIQRQRLKPAGDNQVPVFSRTADTMTIAGHPTVTWATPVFEKEEGKDSVKVTVTGQLAIHYAEDLSFPVPDSLKTVEMIPLFSNGHIALGSEITITLGKVKLLLTTRPRDIRPGKLGKNVFKRPEGYTIDLED